MALQRDEMDFSAGWFDTYKGYPSMRKIKSESDIIAAADRYLSVPPMRESIFNSIKRGETDRRFAHLIIVGTQIPSGISAVSNGCSVTLLLYGHAGDEMLQGGVSIIGFDEYSYRRQLAGLEV